MDTWRACSRGDADKDGGAAVRVASSDGGVAESEQLDMGLRESETGDNRTCASGKLHQLRTDANRILHEGGEPRTPRHISAKPHCAKSNGGGAFSKTESAVRSSGPQIGSESLPIKGGQRDGPNPAGGMLPSPARLTKISQVTGEEW